MGAQVIPSWQEINRFRKPLTDGERRLSEFLEENLPNDWKIFVQPYLNGTCPDVIAFNPHVGMIIYEVKDWDLNSYHWEREHKNKNLDLYFSDSRGSYKIKDPLKQVKHYKKKIISYLVPSIGEEVDKDNKAFGLVKIGVYFHRMSGENARKFFEVTKPHRMEKIVGFDDLESNNLRNVVPGSGIRDGKLPRYMKEEWADEILFWLKPPFHSLGQIEPLDLTPRQEEHAEPQPGHFRLRGVTGGGKTQVIAYRAAKLASQDLDVLVVTYNITLWHFIKDMITRSPFEFEWSRITFNHFHAFCNDTLNNFGRAWPEGVGDDLYTKIVPDAVLETIAGKEYRKWDAILIDEGQDFVWEWYNCLSQFLTERDELFLVCDKQQNIFTRDLSWIDGTMANVKFRGRWRELRTVFRLPRRVADEASRFSRLFELEQTVEVEDVVQLSLFNRDPDPHLVWVNIKSDECLPNIESAYNRLEKQSDPSDIVILLPDRFIGVECVEYFSDHMGITDVSHVFEDDEERKFHPHKKAFWLGDGRLKMCTIHSFKGWEMLNVVLLIPEKQRWNLKKFDAIVYTAITRTRENLIVLNCNQKYKEYGSTWPSKWGGQS